MTGGNAQRNTIAHNIVQPPVVFFHLSAAGSSQPNMRSLKTKKRMPTVTRITKPAQAKIFCKIEKPVQTLCARRLSFSALLINSSRHAPDRLWTKGEFLPSDMERRGGLQGLRSAGRGDSSSDSGKDTLLGAIVRDEHKVIGS